MVIIHDPKNVLIPIDTNPERAPVANGTAILLARGINPRARPDLKSISFTLSGHL